MLSRLQQLTSFLLVLLFASLCTVSQSALGASVATLYADSSQEEQAAPTTLEGLTAEERQELLSRLTDAQVRELVLEMLAQDAAAEQTDPGMIGGFHENIRAFRSEFTEVLSAWPRLSEVIPFFFNQLIPYGKDATTILWVILSCLGIFTIAWLVERFYLRLVQGLETRLLSAEPETFTDKFKFLSLRLVLRLIGLGIFALTSVAALFVIDPESKSIRLTVLTYIFGVVCFRLISQISRFLLAPATSSHRLIPLESPNAKQIHRWILWLGGYASFVILTANHIEDLGLDASLSRLVHFLDGAVYVVLIIVATWQIRKPIRGVLRGSNEQDSVFGSARNVFADLWHVFFTIALLIIYAETQYIRMMGYERATSAAFGTLIMLIAFPLIGVAAQQIIADSARRRIRAKLVEKD
ncbi:MAG: hypothetical protein OEU36_21565, partial [Gammaproteobacteria bacterium]|nr:hypothetical protein [Gammaproteobacteria bacterium]